MTGDGDEGAVDVGAATLTREELAVQAAAPGPDDAPARAVGSGSAGATGARTPASAEAGAAVAATLRDGLSPLHPSAVPMWRIQGALSLLLMGPAFAAVALTILAVRVAGTAEDPSLALAGLLGAAALVPYAILRVGIAPALLHRRWRWRLTEDHLFLQRGLWTERRTLVPLVRVQNVDTVQGPIARRFGLWSVVVATAAHPQSIPFLAEPDAEALRKAIAELARRARDDG